MGSLGARVLGGLAAAPNGAVRQLTGRVQWAHSHIAADNTFCIYLGDREDTVRDHSRPAGFPITRVNEIVTVIDPISVYQELVDAD